MRTRPPAAREGRSPRHWKMLAQRRLAQRRLRQVLTMLDDDTAELGDAFELVEEAEAAIDQLLQRKEVDDG